MGGWPQIHTSGWQRQVFRFFDTNSRIDHDYKTRDTSKSGVEFPILLGSCCSNAVRVPVSVALGYAPDQRGA